MDNKQILALANSITNGSNTLANVQNTMPHNDYTKVLGLLHSGKSSDAMNYNTIDKKIHLMSAADIATTFPNLEINTNE